MRKQISFRKLLLTLQSSSEHNKYQILCKKTLIKTSQVPAKNSMVFIFRKTVLNDGKSDGKSGKLNQKGSGGHT